jgi:hypothetical protein
MCQVQGSLIWIKCGVSSGKVFRNKVKAVMKWMDRVYGLIVSRMRLQPLLGNNVGVPLDLVPSKESAAVAEEAEMLVCSRNFSSVQSSIAQDRRNCRAWH